MRLDFRSHRALDLLGLAQQEEPKQVGGPSIHPHRRSRSTTRVRSLWFAIAIIEAEQDRRLPLPQEIDHPRSQSRLSQPRNVRFGSYWNVLIRSASSIQMRWQTSSIESSSRP